MHEEVRPEPGLLLLKGCSGEVTGFPRTASANRVPLPARKMANVGPIDWNPLPR